jgi:hypothetical protein
MKTLSFGLLSLISSLATLAGIFAIAAAENGIQAPDTNLRLRQFVFLSGLVSTVVFTTAYIRAKRSP